MNHSSWDDEVALFRRYLEGMRLPAEREGRAVPRRPPPRPRPRRIEVRLPLPPGGPEPAGVIERGSRLEYARPGLQRREVRRLRRGQYPVQDQLDLHGHSVAEAERAVIDFLERARECGLRCVRIVHGKGRSSAGGQPVLKTAVDRWLRLCDGILAFCPAPDNAGGTGAVHVLLRS